MKLASVQLTNFRSIASYELFFSYGCQVLIGINESGKSNILRALQLLDPDIQTSHSDIRIERQDESPVTKGLVRFKFELDEKEIEAIYGALTSRFDSSSISKPLVLDGVKSVTLKQF